MTTMTVRLISQRQEQMTAFAVAAEQEPSASELTAALNDVGRILGGAP